MWQGTEDTSCQLSTASCQSNGSEELDAALTTRASFDMDPSPAEPSGKTTAQADTWTQPVTDPEQRRQGSHTWIPAPPKV